MTPVDSICRGLLDTAPLVFEAQEKKGRSCLLCMRLLLLRQGTLLVCEEGRVVYALRRAKHDPVMSSCQTSASICPHYEADA